MASTHIVAVGRISKGNRKVEVAPLAPSLAEWAMEFAAQFQGTAMTEAEIVAEAEDLEEDMLDREYHARGMW